MCDTGDAGTGPPTTRKPSGAVGQGAAAASALAGSSDGFRTVSHRSHQAPPAYAQKHVHRKLRLNEFTRPVRLIEEVKLFWELHPRFTSAAGNTNFSRMAIEYNCIAADRARQSDPAAGGIIRLKSEAF